MKHKKAFCNILWLANYSNQQQEGERSLADPFLAMHWLSSCTEYTAKCSAHCHIWQLHWWHAQCKLTACSQQLICCWLDSWLEPVTETKRFLCCQTFTFPPTRAMSEASLPAGQHPALYWRGARTLEQLSADGWLFLLEGILAWLKSLVMIQGFWIGWTWFPVHSPLIGRKLSSFWRRVYLQIPLPGLYSKSPYTGLEKYFPPRARLSSNIKSAVAV